MNISELIQLQLMMFTMMGTGAFLRRKEIITSSGKNVITDLVINLILPCNIVTSFCIDFSLEILWKGLNVLVISCLIQAVCIFLALHIYVKLPKGKRMVLQYATICSNAGFLGNPVVEGIYGSVGILYASIYLIPQRIVMWSAGVSFFAESPDKKTLAKKVVTHPCIVSVFFGMILMVTQLELPGFLMKSLKSVGGCTTAITMLLIGALLAEADWKTMCTRTTAVFSVLRLIVIPLLTLAGCMFMKMEPLVTGVSVILAAMPAGSTTAILAVKYNGDAEFASKCVVLTTLLSMLMIPAWCMVIHMMY